MYKLGTLKGALSFRPVRQLELRGTAEQYWIVLQTVRRFCLKTSEPLAVAPYLPKH